MIENEFKDRLYKSSLAATQLTSLQDGETTLSKLGGLPEVSVDFEWPTWKGKPLAFLAQIDLSGIPAINSLSELPRKGLLYFFYEQEQSTWGFDPEDLGSWRVIYYAGSDDLKRATPPNGLPSNFIFREKMLEFRSVQSLPSLERLGVDLGTVEDRIFDLWEELQIEALGGEPGHQIGGLPDPVQIDAMELECQLVSNGLYCGDPSGYEDPRAAELGKGAAEWKLLLQIDSDDDSGMMWGDGGRLYFWIRTADLSAADFSKVWLILQCS
jgi:uncharacterized protein YwqG